jgi:nicotinamide phosphoribosyltransferase
MKSINPLLLSDGYKLSHRQQYPDGTELVYSNWTPRGSRIDGIDKVVFFGMQYFIKEYLVTAFNENFFLRDKEEVCQEYKQIISEYLGSEYDIKHIEELWDLGYLPLEIKALPEGSLVPIKVPMFTIKNTNPKFFWLVNFLETLISNVIWQPCTSATLALRYREIFSKWASITGGDPELFDGCTVVDIQAHDFSMRGMGSVESSLTSGMGHAIVFKGGDNLTVMHGLNEYYLGKDDFKVCGVPATEHSVMCAGGKDGEFETFKRLITEIHPEGIVSIVSDTWDLWKVVTDFLPRLKDEIIARNGKVVIRPDSGDPVEILCGKNSSGREEFSGDEIRHPSYKGVVECLYDVFGGTINEKGFINLHPSIGVIYGDAITPARANEICERLANKGFASINWVAGVGSYTYQYNTRDTFGFAMKATYVEVNGEGREIFKDPITDNGLKKSAKGLMCVQKNEFDGEFELIDMVDWATEQTGELKIVFKDGNMNNVQTLSEIRNRVKSYLK